MDTVQIVKFVRDKLLAQGCKSMDEGGHNCRYRGVEGNKCAIGYLIKDEYYKEKLEGRLVEDSLVTEAVEKSLGVELTEHGVDILKRVQTLHDSYLVREWEEGFEEIIRQLTGGS